MPYNWTFHYCYRFLFEFLWNTQPYNNPTFFLGVALVGASGRGIRTTRPTPIASILNAMLTGSTLFQKGFLRNIRSYVTDTFMFCGFHWSCGGWGGAWFIAAINPSQSPTTLFTTISRCYHLTTFCHLNYVNCVITGARVLQLSFFHWKYQIIKFYRKRFSRHVFSPYLYSANRQWVGDIIQRKKFHPINSLSANSTKLKLWMVQTIILWSNS